jgi:hypothetical protein
MHLNLGQQKSLLLAQRQRISIAIEEQIQGEGTATVYMLFALTPSRAQLFALLVQRLLNNPSACIRK